MFVENDGKMAGAGAVGLVLLGPIFGLLYVCFLPLIAFLTLVLALPQNVTAKNVANGENTLCTACHSSHDLYTVFGKGERLSLYVNVDDFKDSVHGFLACTDCHRKISPNSHPDGTAFESRKALSLEAVAVCRSCHPPASEGARSMHAFLTNQSNAPPCTECHGAHTIKRIAQWKKALAGSRYCLICHSRRISKTFGNGEKLSLYMDASQLSASVHNRHACNDCHDGYSETSHPLKMFENGRQHSIKVSEACGKCHPEKTEAVKGSIHYDLLVNEGNMKTPVCTDCHGFHSVGPKATYDTLAGVPCRKCHDRIFGVYAESVHGKARAQGHHQAPLCFSCHFAHEVQGASISEKIRKACVGCHKNVEDKHREWLPNSGLHLSAVACAACHSPKSGKGISLRLYNETTDRPFTEEEIREIMGRDYAKLAGRLGAHGEGVDAQELWHIIRSLNRKGAEAKVTFMGRMEVTDGLDAHGLSVGKKAVRRCEDCHSADSDYFKRVTVAIVRADGRTVSYKAKPEVLGSMISLLSLKEFYVLGGTRLRALDWLGLVMVFGGMLVPIGHITLRILTSPLREARRRNGHGKEDRR